MFFTESLTVALLDHGECTSERILNISKHLTKLWQKPGVSRFWLIIRGVRNPMKISDIGFLKNRTEPTSKFKIRKLSFRGSVLKNRFRRFGDGFSLCFIHNSSCSMIGSTVKIFFFMPYLWTFSSESLRLTISWTNSAWKYVVSSVIHIKCKKPNQKPKPRLI